MRERAHVREREFVMDGLVRDARHSSAVFMCFWRSALWLM